MQCRRITSGANKCSVELCCVHCCELCFVHPGVGSTIAQLCSVHSCVVLYLVHPAVGSTIPQLCSVHSCVVLCLVHPGVGSTKVRPRSLAVHCHTTTYVNQDHHHHQSVQYCVQTEWFSCYESHLI